VRDNSVAVPTCLCADGFYENSSNLCVACPSKCTTCSDENTCILCATGTGRVSSSPPTCDCNPGFFDEGNNDVNCALCDHACDTCLTSSDNCTQCSARDNINSKPGCLCADGYFEDPDTLLCVACSHPCINCTSPTVCLSCVEDANRLTAPTCLCKDTFFENSSLVC
jgi:hypothetical protein